MTRYIQDKSGKMRGRIGDGITPPASPKTPAANVDPAAGTAMTGLANAKLDLSDGFGKEDVLALTRRGLMTLGASIVVLGATAPAASALEAAAAKTAPSVTTTRSVVVPASKTQQCTRAEKKLATAKRHVKTATSVQDRKSARRQVTRWDRVVAKCAAEGAVVAPGQTAGPSPTGVQTYTTAQSAAKFVNAQSWLGKSEQTEIVSRNVIGKTLHPLDGKAWTITGYTQIAGRDDMLGVYGTDADGGVVLQVYRERGNAGMSEQYAQADLGYSPFELEFRTAQVDGVTYDTVWHNGAEVFSLFNGGR